MSIKFRFVPIYGRVVNVRGSIDHKVSRELKKRRMLTNSAYIRVLT